MASPGNPKIIVDSQGISFEGGQHPSMRWDEVYRVWGYKLDGITEVYALLNLNVTWGEHIELLDCFEGLDGAVAAITLHLPGAKPDWFEQVKHMLIDDEPIVVWQARAPG